MHARGFCPFLCHSPVSPPVPLHLLSLPAAVLSLCSACSGSVTVMSSNFALSRTLRRTGSFPSARTVRIVILGQGAVGKTALAVRFITRRFIGEYDPTLETIYRHELTIGGEAVNVEILDTAGQEEDALLMEEKIKWADGFLVVYSVTDRCSFDEVMRLCFLVNHIHSRRSCPDPPPVIIVANKKDLEFDRMVSVEEGESLSHGLKLPLREISVRDGWEETAGVFHALYTEIVQQMDKSPPSFRRRGVSRLMEKIPRLHSNAALGSTGRSFSFSSFRDLLPD